MKKSNILILNLTYILIMTGVYFLAYSATINGETQIFHIALFLIMLWCSKKYTVHSIALLLGTLFLDLTIHNCITLGASLIVGGLMLILHAKTNLKFPKWLLLLYLVLASLFPAYLKIDNGNIFSSFLLIFITLIFSAATIQFIDAVFLKTKLKNLTLDEKLGGAILMLVLAAGLSNFSIFDISLLKVFAVTFILFSAYFGGSTGIACGAAIGLGGTLNSGNVDFITAYSLLALFSVPFKSRDRHFMCLAIIIAELIGGLYFKLYGNYTIFDFLPVLFGVLIFLLLNVRKFNLFTNIFNDNKDEFAVRNIINRSRDGLCKKMLELSDIFYEMNGVFKKMIKGVLPEDEAKEMLIGEVMEKVCGQCPERNKCYRKLSKSTTESLNTIVEIGLKRGKVNILDVPSAFSSNCIKINIIINGINQLLTSYKTYASNIINLDKSKFLLGEEMLGVAGLLKDLSEEVRANVSFDSTFERDLMEELKFINITANEAVVYRENSGEIKITIVLTNLEDNEEKVEKICSKLCGKKMKIYENERVNEFTNLISLKVATSFGVICGMSGEPKGGNSVSGDTYSVLKIGDDKVLLAICDGMGSGKNANKSSELAISLIENLYKVGFNNEIILSSTNRLLSLASDDVFSALDLAVLNLHTGMIDFIKIGGVEGLILRKNGIESVKASSLPLGILEEIKPTIVKQIIGKGEMILLFSDGLLEAFKSINEITAYVDTFKKINPQDLADALLEEGKRRNNGVLPDDVTVLCMKII